eukprot:CAMPEP_0194265272 /NCGR_PEP_ID=MMETSP0169-20130528/582_1 /TAXON_ID=218684 /ORGANISM="Corethron pennatum, Strain L29A3" /LENGTH=118 /DNA_ID=CAMNT_0039005709 /DNA_START=490 /DNA_END=845 /DNA_ORIENTATION=-
MTKEHAVATSSPNAKLVGSLDEIGGPATSIRMAAFRMAGARIFACDSDGPLDERPDGLTEENYSEAKILLFPGEGDEIDIFCAGSKFSRFDDSLTRNLGAVISRNSNGGNWVRQSLER